MVLLYTGFSMKNIFYRMLLLALFLSPSLSLAVTVGDLAPNVELKSIHSGELLSLESLRGKVVLIDFWSSWCASCRQSLPYFDELRKKLTGEKFEVYAVNLDDKKKEALAFLKNIPVSYPIVWDETQDSPEQFAITRMPTSFLLDKDGVIRSVYVEFKKSDISGFELDIRRLLAE